MNKYESILFLESPKLLSSIITHNHTREYPLEVSSLLDQNSSYPIKSEKNNKNNYRDIKSVEVKKNKNKKKVRSKIYVDKDISAIQEDLEFNGISKDLLIRSSKNLKTRKNNKNKGLIKNQNEESLSLESRDIYLDELLTVQELALKLGVSTTDIIKWLFLQGISVTINQLLDRSISTLVAQYYSFNVLDKVVSSNPIEKKKNQEREGDLRAPVITLLGHVDHGKTSLLKALKQNKDGLVIKEAGNITQKIGSYEVVITTNAKPQKLIFLDTPGHEAFMGMRERGADITDIILLVVAADDGLKPQTIEAINYIHSRKLPFIVAINKVDRPEANVKRVRQQLLEFHLSDGDSLKHPLIIEVSALSGNNINLLLSSLVYLSELAQWKSNPLKIAEGFIIDAYLNKQKGPIAQLLIKNGTLHIGDILVSGNLYGKVKAIYNYNKRTVDYLESTALADILCFTEVPQVGLPFYILNNEKQAKKLAFQYAGVNTKGATLNNRIMLNDLAAQTTKTIGKKLNLIIKTGSNGSIDAIVNTLYRIPQGKVQINLIMVACGDISFNDIDLALASNSIILLFDLSISSNISKLIEKRSVTIAQFKVIYDLIDYVKMQMLLLIEIEYSKIVLGYAIVKNIFIVNKGAVAGCLVKSGKLKKNAYFQVKRESKELYTGVIDSLKIVKEDIDEVNTDNECGLLCNKYTDWEVKDLIECYQLKPLEKTL